MKIIDISWPVKPDMAEYGGRSIAQFTPHGNETIVTMVNHTGTHVDGPSYFYKDAKTIDQFSLEKLIGACSVLDLTAVTKKITADDLKQHTIIANTIVLFKTTNSNVSDTT